MSERDYAPLSIACVRGLCDKIYEKRKFAGTEIEKMVKDFSEANNTNQIRRLLRVLGQDLMASTNPNVKNGALMGLSSVAVGLGKDSTVYLLELTQPILACFNESESRVRYQAAEALFNVLKIARAAVLPHFAPVFDALARLAADPEPQVKQGAELLDRLLKDIVTESGCVQLSALVPLLRTRLYTRSSSARQFACGWLAALDAVPGLDLLPHLPQLLDGLFHMLDDPTPEIRRMCEIQLSEFLRSIRKEPARVDYQAMINVLITHAQAAEELVQLTAISWLQQFARQAGPALLPHASGVLLAVLPCLAYADEQRRNIRETAATVNLLLMNLVAESPQGQTQDQKKEQDKVQESGQREDQRQEREKEEGQEQTEGQSFYNKIPHPQDIFPLIIKRSGSEEGQLQTGALVEVLVRLLRHNSVHTKVAALDWILHLYSRLPLEMSAHTEAVFTSCVCVVADPADDVVRRGLAVLAEICSAHPGDLESSPYYQRLLPALVTQICADDALLEDRGAFIIRQLCVLLSAEDVYAGLSRRLAECSPRVAAAGVDLLSTILLTAAELYDLRTQLRHFDTPSSHALFVTLYGCWCHGPVALLALCLLTHNYHHCNRLIATFGDLEITVDFLTEVDKLVQLIESPIFAYLRLELLSDADSSELRSALYGVLMLLPQGEAFHALRRRLQCAPATDNSGAVRARPRVLSLDFDALLEQFKRVQRAHRDYRMADRRARVDK